MHFVILGAGGVGSVVGAHLSRAGHKVSLIGRPAHVDAIRRHGLRLTGVDDFVVWPEAHVTAGDLRAADVLLLTTKVGDTAEALRSAAHLDVSVAASLQNGVAKNGELVAVFGHERVIGGAIAVGARLRAPGVVEQNRPSGILFGEIDGGASERVDTIVRAFEGTLLGVTAVDNIVACEWAKQMITSALGNLICAIAFVPAHVAYSQRPLAEIAVHAVREQAAVARAKGIPVVSPPSLGFDLELYVNAPFEDAVQALIDMGERLKQDGLVNWVPSILQDLLAGRTTEIGATLGFVVQEGESLGVPMPYCQFAFKLIQALQATHRDRLLQPR